MLLGVVQAMCLWGTAMAVVVAEARDVTRTVTAITFVTGFTATIFIPLTEALIALLGWRGALQALAALQLVGAALTVLMLRQARGPVTGAARRDRARAVGAAAASRPSSAWPCASPPMPSSAPGSART